MSGQTVCDLLPVYRGRVKAILLACPAAYHADVHDLPFGSEEFTRKLREPNSWKETDAVNKLSQFKGKTIIASGTEDEVIPKGVTTMLKDAAKDLIYVEYEGATHSLLSWFEKHPEDLTCLVDKLAEDR